MLQLDYSKMYDVNYACRQMFEDFENEFTIMALFN